jgi:hypothetical protein
LSVGKYWLFPLGCKSHGVTKSQVRAKNLGLREGEDALLLGARNLEFRKDALLFGARNLGIGSIFVRRIAALPKSAKEL